MNSPPPPDAGSQVRAAGNYNTSSIRSVSVQNLSDGRQVELFENPTFSCGQPDVPGNPATTGVHEFSLFYPVGYDRNNPRPFVLYTYLIGGEVGWIDVDGRYTGQPGTYRGPAFVATASYNRDRMEKFGEGVNISVLVSRLKAAHPDWAFLMPSYCSHDVYNGMGEGADFPRYGWLALAGAVKYVHDRFGIDHMFAEGGSSGASGSFFLARDIKRVIPDLDLRGVVFNSEAHEFTPLASLYDSNVSLVLPDPRGGTAVVPCQADFEPASVALLRSTSEAGGVSASASADILSGLVQVPIYHLWGRREHQFCQDEAYSDQYLHGAIARAIVSVNPAQRSWNRRVCEDDPDWPLPCGKHGELDGLPDLEAGDRNPDVSADVQAWIEKLHSNYANAITQPQDH